MPLPVFGKGLARGIGGVFIIFCIQAEGWSMVLDIIRNLFNHRALRRENEFEKSGV